MFLSKDDGRPTNVSPVLPFVKHGKHDQSSHAGGRGGGKGRGDGKGKPSGGAPTVRQMQDAAAFLDNFGDVGSEHFAPHGIGSMGPENARRMIDHAKKLGWRDSE